MAVYTPRFRVSYPTVFEPRLNKLSKKMEYSVQALFKKGEDLSALKEITREALENQFGQDPSTWPKGLRSPYVDQGTKAKTVEGQQVLPDGYEDGAIMVNLKSTKKPGLVNEQAKPFMDQSEFYGGCYAIATVNAKAYDVGDSRGVAIYLNNIQKVADGEPFGSRTLPEQDFKPVEPGGGQDSAEGGGSQDATSLY